MTYSVNWNVCVLNSFFYELSNWSVHPQPPLYFASPASLRNKQYIRELKHYYLHLYWGNHALVLLEFKGKCSLVIDSQHVKYLRKCTMFRSDVKQNKGNNLTFGVILLALEVMSIKFRLSHMCFLKRILGSPFYSCSWKWG